MTSALALCSFKIKRGKKKIGVRLLEYSIKTCWTITDSLQCAVNVSRTTASTGLQASRSTGTPSMSLFQIIHVALLPYYFCWCMHHNITHPRNNLQLLNSCNEFCRGHLCLRCTTRYRRAVCSVCVV